MEKMLGKKKILIKHEYVDSIKDIMILNERMSEFMHKDNKK
jgi:sporulation protein YlmC with PRC-barrel domain